MEITIRINPTAHFGVLDDLFATSPVLDNVSQFYVPLAPVLVGPEPASASGQCCSRQPRVRHGHLDDLFPTCWKTESGLLVEAGVNRI